jgi:hypothetical protein
MGIQEQLDFIEQQKKDLLEMTPAEHKTDEIRKLFHEVENAKRVQKEAPDDVINAETKYYKARYGSQYLEKQLQTYTIEGRTVRADMVQAHEKLLSEMDQSLSYYDSQQAFLKNIGEVQLTLYTSIQKSLRKIRKSETSTNNRKTFYTEQQETRLSFWVLVCDCIIISQVGLLGLEYKETKEQKLILKMVGFLVSIFLLSTILTWLGKIPKTIQVYLGWGYDPLESKIPWFFIVPIYIYVVWLLIHHFT